MTRWRFQPIERYNILWCSFRAKCEMRAKSQQRSEHQLIRGFTGWEAGSHCRGPEKITQSPKNKTTLRSSALKTWQKTGHASSVCPPPPFFFLLHCPQSGTPWTKDHLITMDTGTEFLVPIFCLFVIILK